MSTSTSPEAVDRNGPAEDQSAVRDVEATPAPLSFDSDAGSSRSKWVAGLLVLLIVGWMGSGYVLPSAPEEAAPSVAEQAARLVTVAVTPSRAEEVAQVFVAEGQALPDRDTMIRAETSGEIAEVLVRKGADVTAGETLARFDTASRASDLARAREEEARAQREFENAEQLLERGVATMDRVTQARAALASARAGVAAAEEAIENTEIRAPFAGRLEAFDIAEGEFVPTGAEVGRVVDNTPLTIRIQIPQQSLVNIEVGQPAEVNFITGTEATGEVIFVSSSADAETRTFAAEISVPNAEGTVPAGVSARVRIPTGSLRAHFVSPAILSLGTDGTLGIKTVDEEGIVHFHEVSIVRAQTDGIWVAGLPEDTRIVTVGQGFVSDGEKVNPQERNAEGPAAAQATIASLDDKAPGADAEAGAEGAATPREADQ
jgi:membrane fusion protein, multidrug efflux system